MCCGAAPEHTTSDESTQRHPHSAPPELCCFRREEEPICLLCDKTFRNVNKLKQHEEEEHVSCDFFGCEYKGPVHVMVMHKLKHLKNEKG